MLDNSTKEPLYVSTDGESVPYIMVPVQQIDDVRTLLNLNGVAYWVDEEAISVDGEPAITVINLSRDADVAAVQKILNSAS